MNTSKTWLKKAIVFLVVAAMAIALFPFTGFKTVTKAAAGDTPAHTKDRKNNGDGTYTLSLSVTGDALVEEITDSAANILIVYDTSTSMTNCRAPLPGGTYGGIPTGAEWGQTNYYQLYHANAAGTGGNANSPVQQDEEISPDTVLYYRTGNNQPWQQYTQKYEDGTYKRFSSNANDTRADFAEDALHDFCTALSSYSGVRIAVVTFDDTAVQNNIGWATPATAAGIFDDGIDRDYSLSYHNNTRWDRAFNQAVTTLGNIPDAYKGNDTYVLFVTDGMYTGGDTTFTNSETYSRRVEIYDTVHSTYNTSAAGYADNTTLFGVYAFGTNDDYLDEVIYYSQTEQHRTRNGSTDTTGIADSYYRVESAADFLSMIDDIFQKIVQALGISTVSVADGTTQAVTTSSGEIAELLEVDESSYQYHLTIPMTGPAEDGSYSFTDNLNNNIKVTVSGTTANMSWTDSTGTARTASYVIEEQNEAVFKLKWDDKAETAFYAAAPKAQLVNGEVDWNLSSLGTLLNRVTYTVTFDVYPSQETLDTVADIKNDPGETGAWADLDEEIQKYIDYNGNLKTNTGATLTYSDTRLQNPGPKTAVFNDLQPVPNSAVEELAVSKNWKNLLEDDWKKPDHITLVVTRDNIGTYDVVLNDDNEWTDNVFISVGIMKDGKVLHGSEGHEFTFTEFEDYKWEIKAPIVHPMLINNVLTMLIQINEENEDDVPEGAVIYENPFKNGFDYYVGDAEVVLTATNERRSSVNVKKIVENEDAPADAVFPFTLNVVNSLAPDTAPTSAQDPKHESDWWVWISVRDYSTTPATPITTGIEGATHDGGGWWYAPSGTNIQIPVKAGYSIRMNNLPEGSTYSIAEGTLPEAFTFDKSEIAIVDGDTSAPTTKFRPGKTTTGAVEATNAVYEISMYNDYALVDVTVDKVWNDNSDQDGLRPDDLELTLHGLPTGTAAPEPIIVKSEDGNTWTYTWKGLPKADASGTPYTYTVTEDNVPDGYTKSPETAVSDHGTITNTHTPEEVDVTITKVWDDSDDIGKIRPTSIQAQLKAGNTAVGDPVTLNADNEWTYTWEGLPKKNDGQDIVYSADETSVPTGYTKKDGDPAKTTDDDGNITFTVTNIYSPTPTTASFPVKKILSVPTGMTGPTTWSYTINVAAEDGAPEATTMTGTVSNTADTANFGPITYTLPGTYTYTVSEVGEIAGVTNDADAAGKTVTVTVTDDGTGKLSATASSTSETPLTFTNTYGSQPVEISFPVKKILSVPEGMTGPTTWSYTINVVANGGAPQAQTMTGTVTNAADTATFGPFRFTAPGQYTYTVSETGTVKGVTNDADAAGKTVTVTVIDNGNGTLTATASSTEASPLKFTNTYNVEPTTASFPVVKELVVPEGLEGPAQWSYTINVKADKAEYPVAETMTGTVNKTTTSVSFGPITYNQPGEYTYTVSESGTVTGVTNDPDAAGKTVTVSVVDNGDGTLTATPSSTTASPLKFTNTYKVGTIDATFPVKKILSVPEGLTGPAQWEYTITVAADKETYPTAATMTGTVNQSKDTVSFGPFTYNAPGTYTYTVTESGTVAGVTNDEAATTGKTVTVTVTDDGAGALKASVSSTAAAPLTFTNTYDVEPTTASFPVEKILSVPQGMTGPAKWSYTIDVAAQGTAPAAETMTGTVDQDNTTATFGPFTYNKAGTYTYKVTETGTVAGVTNDAEAAAGKTVTVTVVDNGNGTLTATADSTEEEPLQFTNTYNVEPTTASFPVEKILSVPEGLDGPEKWEYTINVATQDGAPVAATMTGKVNQDKESITFGPFEYTAPGEYTYTVSETGTVAGVTNDAQAAGKTVTVNVVDNGDGTLTATASSTTDKPLQFTNTYNVGEIEASFPVKKELVVPAGLEGPAQWSYRIDVAVVDGAPAAETMSGTVNQTTDTVTFGPFKYTAPGTYKYKVTETGTIAGVTNDAEAATGKEVTVTVTDSGDGTLTATASSTAAAPLTFTNNYDAEPTTAQIPVKKNITPANSGANDITGKFTFTLAAGSNTAGEGVETPMPASNTVLCGTDGAEVQFGEIEFSVPGTYTYTVKESVTGDDTATSIDGITLETKDPKTLTVVVTDKGDGTLEAVVNGNVVTEFNNPYTVTSIDITIPVEKILSVPEGLTAPDITNAFTFTLADDSSDDVKSPLPKTTSITNPSATGGNMNFGTKDDPITISVPGEYLYTITETGTVDGVTNDATGTKTVKVTVTNNGDGTLSYTLDSDKVSFTNTYNVVPVTAEIPVEKILEVGEGLNAPDITEEFTFTLTAGTNTAAGGIATPMPEVTEYTNPDADGGDMTFGDITYTEPGTYTYTVTETGEVDGVSAVGGVTVQTVTVVVVDNSDGTMTATVNGGETVTFINEYKVGEATAVIPVTKILNVAEGLDPNSIANMFTFTLTAGTNTAAGDIATPMPKTTSFTNPSADGGTVTFGGTDDPITFTAPGTYTYTVTETGSAPGVINDATATKDVTVVVTDNGDGTMTAVTNEGKALEFTNTYDVEPTEVSFPVKKILSKPDDATGPVEWSYRIDVAANNGAPVAETMTGTVSNTADTATFGPFKYYAPGTFTYTVTETGEIKGVTNDPAATAGKTVTVSVVDNGNGTMTATADSKVDAPLTFTNSYSYENVTATPAVHKTLSFEEGLTPPDITEKYTFKLEAVTEGAPMPAADAEVKNPAADGGTKSFGTITFTRPGTYEYKVTETGTVAGVTNDEAAATGKTFKIIVTDNLEGKLVATIDYGTDEGHVTFINTYKVEPVKVSFPVEKVLEEDEESDLTPLDITGKFTFDLAAVTAGAPMPAVTSQKNPDADGGTVTFGDIEFKKPGTYEYKVTETGEVAFVDNDPDAVNGKTITVTVTDNRDGTMTATTETTAENPVKFINTRQQVSATVKKVWDDFDDRYGKRPESLDVDLMANGEKERTVTLNAGNQWTVTVKDLPKYDAEGEEITYTWVEGKMPAGYELTNTETEGRVTTLTNSRRYGDLVIRKDLTKYNNFISENPEAAADQATFIFHITAKKGDTEVYEDYVGLTFNGDEMTNKVEIKGMIPVGAVVTVVEDYDGAGYAVQGQSTKTVTITDPTDTMAEVAEADFTNAYDDRIPGGYGIVNHYTKDNNGRWTGENIEDNRVRPTVE